jgi:acetyl-CoA synthetase
MPHEIKGQALYAYVTPRKGVKVSDHLVKALMDHVRQEIGPIARPEVIQFADGLPKTRSGKIMRRILRRIAQDETGDLGDTTTLSDPTVIEMLIAGRK